MARPRHIIPAEIAEFIRYWPETGQFTWIKVPDLPSRAKIGGPAGSTSTPRRPYREIKFRKIQYKAARVAYFLMTGEQPENVDHVDCDPTNNTWANLRAATVSQNAANRRSWAAHLKGVSRTKSGRFSSSIFFDGRSIRLGTYETEEAAHDAYAVAAHKYHGEFARTE